MDSAPQLIQARATYRGGLSELDAALHLLYPPDKDMEVGEVRIFMEGAGRHPPPPPPADQLVVRRNDGNPSICRRVRGIPPEANLVPCPPASHPRVSQLGPPTPVPPPLSRTRSAHQTGQALRQERPGSPLHLPAVATDGDPEPAPGAKPTHPYGAAPVPCPALPAAEARDGVHTFLQNDEVTAVRGVHLVRPPPATRNVPRGPRA